DLPLLRRTDGMDLEPPRSARRAAEGERLLRVGRLSVRAALVRGRAAGSVRPRDRRVAHRHGGLAHPHVLAERVQPGPRAVSADELCARRKRERAALPVPVLYRRARRASVLMIAALGTGSMMYVGRPFQGRQARLKASPYTI